MARCSGLTREAGLDNMSKSGFPSSAPLQQVLRNCPDQKARRWRAGLSSSQDCRYLLCLKEFQGQEGKWFIYPSIRRYCDSIRRSHYGGFRPRIA